jgi:predicted esterase
VVTRSSKDGSGGQFAVRLTSDVCFGRAGIRYNEGEGRREMRDLLMDVYAPVGGDPNVPRPAIVLAFGGAYHRGSKENDSFEDGEWRNTSVAEYCREFATSGYVCFALGYRLTSEDPDPGPQRVLADPGGVSRARIDVVRKMLGLGPATAQMLSDGMEAAAADVATGLRFIQDHASEFGVDPSRIIAGGFSAGGISALYAVLAHGAPASALIVLSGRFEAPDIPRYMRDARQPPILQFVSENDLEHIRRLTADMQEHSAKLGLRHVVYHVPRAGHFYPRSAAAIAPDGCETTVEGAMRSFLDTL